MASLMESFEQQYATLTSDITSRVGRIPNQTGGEKISTINNVDRLLEETREVLEQMELEVRELSGRDREKYQTRLQSYQKELVKLEADFKRSRIAFSDSIRAREELFSLEDSQTSEDQRIRLLDNTERLERSSKRLQHGYQTVVETEQIGAQIMDDLRGQRETIGRSRDKLRDTDANLGRSSRLLSAMMKRVIQNRILLAGVALILIVTIICAIYFGVKKKS